MKKVGSQKTEVGSIDFSLFRPLLKPFNYQGILCFQGSNDISKKRHKF